VGTTIDAAKARHINASQGNSIWSRLGRWLSGKTTGAAACVYCQREIGGQAGICDACSLEGQI
jgi:hypothetical protein